MELVDVYICYNSPEAELALEILRENDIESTLRDMRSRAFPVNDDASGRIMIGVLADQAAKARGILREAAESDALRGDGHVIEDS